MQNVYDWLITNGFFFFNESLNSVRVCVLNYQHVNNMESKVCMSKCGRLMDVVSIEIIVL